MRGIRRSPGRWRLALVPVAVVALLGTGAPAAGSSPLARGAITSAPTPPPNTVATELTPLIADFDGDARSDVLWYGPSSLPDHLWLGRPDRNFVGVPTVVSGTYRPLVGDFNGDVRRDVLWYGPGSGRDVLWLGRSGGTFATRSLTVSGTYEPFVGDFNGDARDDVFWYGPGAAQDVVWYGRVDGTFASRRAVVSATFRPLVGDFDGDGRDDVFWYAAGSASDWIWYGTRTLTFIGRAATVTGSYVPLVGDFNGDGSSDVLWYGAGAARDVLWFGRVTRGFRAIAITVSGTYRPFVGDFNGDRRVDVFWYGPGVNRDVLWFGRSTGASAPFAPGSVNVTGTYAAHVADYGGDRIADIFWYARGAAYDHLWFGLTSGLFSRRATTIDLEYKRSPPLRQEVLAGEGYVPSGFVAHAMGSIDDRTYTNSLEAFERNYARGFRVFEVDQVLLKDGTVLAAHDGLESDYGLSATFREATWAQLDGRKYLDLYTILRSQDVIDLLRQHPDVYVILDIKYSSLAVYRTYMSQTADPAVRERIVPHVRTQTDLNGLRTVYPVQNYVVALYATQSVNQFDDPVVIDFTRRNRSPAVMMWSGTRNHSLTLAENGLQRRRYTPPFAAALKAAGATVFVHSLDDPAVVQTFWDSAVGVYSNEPFPPLGSEPEQLLTPTFRGTTVPGA